MLGIGKKRKKKQKLEGYDTIPEKLVEESHPELKKLVDRIMDSTGSRRKEMTDRLKEYRNKVWDETKLNSNDSRISFNFLFAIVSTISALLTDSKPKAKIIPLFPYLSNTVADAYNRNIDYIWEKLELQDMIYKTVTWSEITSLGIAKIGYSKGEGVYGLYYDIIDPRDFFIAPGYEDLWDAPFCGFRETVPVSKIKELFPKVDLKSDVFYCVDEENKAIDEQLKYSDATDSFVNSAAGRVQWYQVWMRTDELLVKGEDGKDIKAFPNGITVYFTADKYLGYVENEYLHKKPPFVALTDYYNPGMFDSISEGDQIHGITKEINLQLQAMMLRARRQSNPSWLIDTDQVDDVEQIKEDMKAGKTGQGYAYSSGRTQSGRPPVVDLLPKETDQTSWTIVSSFKGIIEYILGYTDMLRGETTKTERQSAVEVSILSEASSVRIRPKIRNLEKFIKRVTYLYVCLMQQYWIGDDHWIENKTDTGREYYNFKSSVGSINKMLVDDDLLKKILTETEEALKPQLSKAQSQEYDDYMNFATWAKGEGLGNDDPAMFPFEVEVESDSTLPLDRQSRAQLFLRLYAMKAVDREAVLTELEIKNKDEIIKRMSKLDKLTTQAQNKKVIPGQEAKNV